MPDMRFQAKTASHTEIPRPKRGEGQWALGYTEPLNKNEQSKKDDDPLNVRDRILNIYSKRGFALDRPGRPARPVPLDGSLHPARARLRRRQDRDARGGGARRRVLHDAGPLRRRGCCPPTQCARSASIGARLRPRHRRRHRPARTSSTTGSGSRTSRRSGSGSTTPGWTPPRPAATRRAPFLGSPVAGVAKDEIIDGSAALDEIKRRSIGNPEFSNLPRKFKTALTGHPSHDVSPETNDVSFVGTVHPEHGPGFDLWVGGGLSTNPMLAQKLGVWIPLDEVRRRLGGRHLDLPRLRLPPAALARPAEVPGRRLGRREVPRGARERVPRPRARRLRLARRRPPATATTSACTSRRTASFYVGVAPTVGPDLRHACWSQLADLIEEYGVAGARLTPYQKIVLIGVDAGPGRARCVAGLDEIGLPARPSQLAAQHDGLHRHRVLQARDRRHQGRAPATWSPSSSGASPTSTPRSRSTSTAAPTPAPAPRSPTSASRASWSCDDDGKQVEGFQVHLGGATGLQANFGRKLRAHKVTSAGLDDYVTVVVVATTSPTARPTSRSRPGSPAPTRSCCAARRPSEERRRHERARGSRSTAPTAASEDLWPHERGRLPHGSWECRGCLRAFSLKMLGLVRPGASTPGSASS